MRINKPILVVAALSLSAFVWAETGKHLSIIPADNPDEPVHIALEGLQKITFDADNNMIITHSDGNRTVAIDGIGSIRFDMEISSKDEIDTDIADDITMKLSGGILSLTYKSDKVLSVEIFDIKGRKMFAVEATGTVNIDFNKYPAGVYIVKANDKIIKIKN